MEGFDGGAVADGGAQDTGSDAAESQGLQQESRDTQGATGQGTQKGQSQKAQNQQAIEKALDELSDADLDKVVKVKLDGEVKKLTVRELQKLGQLEHVSRKKMSEADLMKRQVLEVAHLAKTNPKKFFEMVGVDPYEFSEATLAEKLKLLEESPEQRELRELREFKQRQDEMTKAQKEQAEKEELTKVETKAQQEFESGFMEAWKDSGFPPHRRFGQMLAAEKLSAASRGEDLSWQQAAVKLKQNFSKDVQEILGSLDATAIQQVLGEGTLKKIREFEVSRVGQTPPTVKSGAGPGAQGPVSKSERKSSQAMTEKEYRAWQESLKR